MSGFCKVEMSKLPFRGAISEAEIGSFTMSRHELQRIEVLSEVLAKIRTEVSAAAGTMDTWRYGGRGRYFPTGSSTRISVSAIWSGHRRTVNVSLRLFLNPARGPFLSLAALPSSFWPILRELPVPDFCELG